MSQADSITPVGVLGEPLLIESKGRVPTQKTLEEKWQGSKIPDMRRLQQNSGEQGQSLGVSRIPFCCGHSRLEACFVFVCSGACFFARMLTWDWVLRGAGGIKVPLDLHPAWG